MRRRDRDHDARLADPQHADAVVDRYRTEVVALPELASELRHHLLGHLGVGLVLEPRHLAAARLPPYRAGEGRETAGALVGHLCGDGLERKRLLGHPERAARDRRDQRHLVAVMELAIRVGVLAVDGVEKAGGLLAEPERGPHVRDGRDVELALRPARLLAQAGEEADANHRRSVLDKKWRIRHRYGETAVPCLSPSHSSRCSFWASPRRRASTASPFRGTQ